MVRPVTHYHWGAEFYSQADTILLEDDVTKKAQRVTLRESGALLFSFSSEVMVFALSEALLLFVFRFVFWMSESYVEINGVLNVEKQKSFARGSTRVNWHIALVLGRYMFWNYFVVFILRLPLQRYLLMLGDIHWKYVWKSWVCCPCLNFLENGGGFQTWFGHKMLQEERILFNLSFSLEIQAERQIQGFQNFFGRCLFVFVEYLFKRSRELRTRSVMYHLHIMPTWLQRVLFAVTCSRAFRGVFRGSAMPPPLSRASKVFLCLLLSFSTAMF